MTKVAVFMCVLAIISPIFKTVASADPLMDGHLSLSMMTIQIAGIFAWVGLAYCRWLGMLFGAVLGAALVSSIELVVAPGF